MKSRWKVTQGSKLLEIRKSRQREDQYQRRVSKTNIRNIHIQETLGSGWEKRKRLWGWWEAVGNSHYKSETRAATWSGSPILMHIGRDIRIWINYAPKSRLTGYPLAKARKESKCPWTQEWMKTKSHVYTHSGIMTRPGQNGLMSFATTEINLETIIASEVRARERNTIWYHL